VIVFDGAVLTGGASRRMGRDKATLEVDGVPMAVRVARALEAAGAVRVVAVGVPVRATGALPMPVIPDEHPGAGPLGGLLTALRSSVVGATAVLACDLVDPSPAAIAALVDVLADHAEHAEHAEHAAVVPRVDGRPQWLHGVWVADRCLPALDAAFAAGERSIHRAVAGLAGVRFVDLASELTAHELRDADEPQDLDAVDGRRQPPVT